MNVQSHLIREGLLDPQEGVLRWAALPVLDSGWERSGRFARVLPVIAATKSKWSEGSSSAIPSAGTGYYACLGGLQGNLRELDLPYYFSVYDLDFLLQSIIHFCPASVFEFCY